MILKQELFFLLHVRIDYDEIVNVENIELLFPLVLNHFKHRKTKGESSFYHMEHLLHHVHQINQILHLVLMDIYLILTKTIFSRNENSFV
jgi:hypothetical protein